MQLDDKAILAAVSVKLVEERSSRVALQNRIDELARVPGPQGERGMPGEHGAAGPEGPAGPQGIAGEPGAPGTLELAVPNDIAEQVAKSIAILKESSSPVTTGIIRSERRGKKGPPGERGPAGPAGPAGRDGADGIKGDDGAPGRDGISVAGAAINREGELTLTLSNGTVLTPGRIEVRTA